MTTTTDLPLAGATPRVGAKVIATRIPHVEEHPSYPEEVRRQVVTVKAVSDRVDSEGRIRIWADFLSDPSDPNSHKYDWYFYDWKPAEDESDEPEVVRTLRGTLANTQEALENAREEIRNIRNKFSNSMEIISRQINEEADNRGWCDEFERIVDDVNSDLPGPFYLEKRNKTFRVTWTEEYRIRVHRSADIEAKSDELAIEEIQEWDEADTYDIKQAIDQGDCEFIDADDYEAEEV